MASAECWLLSYRGQYITTRTTLNQGPSLYAGWWLGAIVVRQVQRVSCCVRLHKDRQGGHLVPQLPRM